MSSERAASPDRDRWQAFTGRTAMHQASGQSLAAAMPRKAFVVNQAVREKVRHLRLALS
jgi:hypothetical protein